MVIGGLVCGDYEVSFLELRSGFHEIRVLDGHVGLPLNQTRRKLNKTWIIATDSHFLNDNHKLN